MINANNQLLESSISCQSVLDPWHVCKKLVNKITKKSSEFGKKRCDKVTAMVKTHFTYCLRNCSENPTTFLELWNNAPVHWKNNSTKNHDSCHQRSNCKQASITDSPKLSNFSGEYKISFYFIYFYC